jgi:hypothetical protein
MQEHTVKTTIGPDGKYEFAEPQQSQQQPVGNQLLRTGEDLVECLRTNPRRIAEAMGRLHRFGGQVEGCTVLAHSLRVYYDTLGQSPRTRLWALLHDVHEVLTGEVVRTHKGIELRTFQTRVDWLLLAEFCPDITEAERRAVRDADDATNRREHKRWQTGGTWHDADNVRLWLESLGLFLQK